MGGVSAGSPHRGLLRGDVAHLALVLAGVEALAGVAAQVKPVDARVQVELDGREGRGGGDRVRLGGEKRSAVASGGAEAKGNTGAGFVCRRHCRLPQTQSAKHCRRYKKRGGTMAVGNEYLCDLLRSVDVDAALRLEGRDERRGDALQQQRERKGQGAAGCEGTGADKESEREEGRERERNGEKRSRTFMSLSSDIVTRSVSSVAVCGR